MTRSQQTWKWPLVAMAGTILLAGCQTVAHSRYPDRGGVYQPQTTSGAQVYRTADGRVFRTRAERDAYLYRVERARQAEIDAIRARDLDRSRGQAQSRAIRREAKIERQRRRAEAAEQARLQAEADQRAAERQRRRAERQANRQNTGVNNRISRTGGDADIAAREARRRARQAAREADRAQREERILRRQAQIEAQTRTNRRQRAASAQVPLRPEFYYDRSDLDHNAHKQRWAFYLANRLPGEKAKAFWRRPTY